MTPERGTLGPTEPHPSAHHAMAYIRSIPYTEMCALREALASCAIDGNREAVIACKTLRLLEAHEPVSDRYLMGLAWMLWYLREKV
jgi:hypothetical protein